MPINNFNSFSRKNPLYRLTFPILLINFILFSLVYSFPSLIPTNTLPTKYFQKIKINEIEENANLYLLSTKDGYLHALDNNSQEIWKTFLDQELMSSSALNPKQITKNMYLFPFNEQLYIIKDFHEFTPFDAFIKDLVKKQYISLDDLTLLGKTKTTIYVIDLENGEILQKIDEDSNFISNKKIYIRQKNRRKKTLTVVRVDYILNCIQINEEEKYWNASYSDILIKKGNEFDNFDDNNFFIDTTFVKKLINEYKNNNLENSEIDFDKLVTAYAYFNKEDTPNIKIYDKSISSKNLNSLDKKEMNREMRYLDNYNMIKNGGINDNLKIYEDLIQYNSRNYLADEHEEKKVKINKMLNYIKDNYILILIIIILCFIIFFIISYYNRKIEINNVNKEMKIDKKVDNEVIEKEENLKKENNYIKNYSSDRFEKANTNITEESKDFFEEDNIEKEEIKEEKEIIEEEKDNEINIINENKTSNSINNINKEIEKDDKDKVKEISRVKNSLWDSDDDEEEEEDDDDEKEKSKTKNKQKSKTISNKSKEKTKSKLKKESDEEEDEEESNEGNDKNKNEILIKNSIIKEDEKFEDIIFESKTEKEKEKENIKVKKKMTRLDTDFENLEKIGEGGYGLVLKGTHRIDKFIYAIKIINISDFKNNAEIDEIVNEANKMSLIKDKYIVNYNICWYEDDLGSAEKFYEKKEEESISKSSSMLLNDDKSIKSNNSTKLIQQESKMDNLRSLYCTRFRDDSKLVNNSLLSMKYKKKFFMILMEYCDGNTLEDLIKKHINDSTPIDRKLIYNYTKQILKGLKVLHRNGIIHSDIKPGNIFLKKSGEIEQIKIGDFGMAMIKKGANKLKSKNIKGFTPLYSAPEQKNKKGTYNEKIDIYACGLILYELIGCFGTNAEKYRAFDYLKNSGKIFDEIENKYKEECELIKIMTKKDYDERPSAEEILGNSIFKELGKIVNK